MTPYTPRLALVMAATSGSFTVISDDRGERATPRFLPFLRRGLSVS